MNAALILHTSVPSLSFDKIIVVAAAKSNESESETHKISCFIVLMNFILAHKKFMLYIDTKSAGCAMCLRVFFYFFDVFLMRFIRVPWNGCAILSHIVTHSTTSVQSLHPPPKLSIFFLPLYTTSSMSSFSSSSSPRLHACSPTYHERLFTIFIA